MKREFLENFKIGDQPLSKEVIDAILAENDRDAEEVKKPFHNWYFADPIDQRGVSGNITTAGYFLDCWKLMSGSVTIGSDGITLNGTIAQALETAFGTNFTASALTTGGCGRGLR